MLQAPSEVKLVLRRLKRKTWSDIRRALDEELRSLETSRVVFGTSPVVAARPATRNARIHSTVATRGCAFCENPYRASECGIYSSAQARVNRLKSLKLCVRCMRPNHTADKCTKTSVKCFECSGPHYRFLCPAAAVRPAIPDAHPVPQAHFIASLPPAIDPPMHILNVNSSVVSDVRSPMLNVIGRASLMTLFLDVWAASTSVRIRALVDPGADICLVTSRLCSLAGSTTHSTGVQRLSVGGGLSSSGVRGCAFVPICPPGGEEVGRIQACVLDTITEPISHSLGVSIRRLLEKHSILVHDCSTAAKARQTPIDLLIGMDATMNFLTGQKTIISEHLCAINTVVGWCVAGVEASSAPSSSSSVVLTAHVSEHSMDFSRLWAVRICRGKRRLSRPTSFERWRTPLSSGMVDIG